MKPSRPSCAAALPLQAGKSLARLFRAASFEGIVGNSRPMRRLFDLLERVAGSSITVLIQGETGTGKELIARAVHLSGTRAKRKFIALNCASLPEELLESELFGHVRGAFTGAVADKAGLLAGASGGTVFLDEIAECSPRVQAKLLRVLQDGVIRPLGGTRERRVDVRVIVATNRDLEKEVKNGRFRKDLFYRLNIFPLTVPPLRERREDVPALARHFLERYAKRAGKSIEGITREAMHLLAAYDFPGNVRELENEMERVAAMHGGRGPVTAGDLSAKFRSGSKRRAARVYSLTGGSLKETLRDVEREVIARTLSSFDGNITRTAKRLGISRYGLYKKIARYNILPGNRNN